MTTRQARRPLSPLSSRSSSGRRAHVSPQSVVSLARSLALGAPPSPCAAPSPRRRSRSFPLPFSSTPRPSPTPPWSGGDAKKTKRLYFSPPRTRTQAAALVKGPFSLTLEGALTRPSAGTYGRLRNAGGEEEKGNCPFTFEKKNRDRLTYFTISRRTNTSFALLFLLISAFAKREETSLLLPFTPSRRRAFLQVSLVIATPSSQEESTFLCAKRTYTNVPLLPLLAV